MSDVTPAKAHETVVHPDAEPAAALPEPVETEPSLVEPLAETDPEPVETTPELVEPETHVAPETAEVRAVTAEPVTAEPLVAEPEAEPVPVAVAPVAAPQQQIYIERPIPPKRRGNRLVGSLLAVVGAVIFAGLFAVVGGLIIDLRDRDLFGPEFVSFVGSAFYWVPVAVFLVALILLVLVLNRAGWWAHVFGSLILAIAVYFATIGVLLLIANVFHGTPTPITFDSLALNPWVIAAAVVAREVSIWTGLGIAARGRRVKARNVEARSAFEREQDAKRAEYAGTATEA